ncbi:MAG: DUF3427 domain-containing protein, partial [Desulfovibrionaceae bacterium]|nr:DUF3427 domain-containing protein [Desulfovibrionaceae bacterium]
ALGKQRALLISATGTGKTFAAAFAVKKMQPRRVLFLVHREQIARQAKRSFFRVLGGSREDYGLLSGNEREQSDRKYVFATMQTVAREEILRGFAPDAFDFILIDEVHRAGAPSYQRIMEHFSPDFWFGMTGSPDRPDGFDIYNLFEYNIVYEIRLGAALRNNLLCPFHYFGIGELSVNYNNEERAYDTNYFINLDNSEVIRHIIEKAEYFGFSGSRVKGLIFASTNDRAQKIAEGFNRNGYKALALSGDNSQEERQEAVRRLTQEHGENRYDYLVTVDIFNEGVDIPEVNQVILLRPTESPIIFIQQLGRGLRRHIGKEFVVVLDFIGVHKNNFMIPMALGDDRSYSKESMRRTIRGKSIPGQSSISFDRVAEDAILRAIDEAKTQSIKILKENYLILKRKLGRIPNLLDYEAHGQIDAIKFLQAPTNYSYYNFLKLYEPEYRVTLSDDAARRISWLSRKLANSVRPSEVFVLQGILTGERDLRQTLVQKLQEVCSFEATNDHIHSVELMLTNQFERTVNDRNRNEGMTFISVADNGDWTEDANFAACLDAEPDFRAMVEELCLFVLKRWHAKYSQRYGKTMFALNELYTYDDVCRLLDWNILLTSL